MIIVFGEVLWDIFADGRVLGGAPANFCNRLNTLDVKSLLISAVGNDNLGAEALGLLREAQVETKGVQISGDKPTGTVKVEIDDNDEADYEIIKDVAYDYISADQARDVISFPPTLIYFGALIQRNNESRVALADLLASYPQAKKFCDINLRKDCYDRDIVEQSLTNADIVKMNVDELAEIAGPLGENEHEFEVKEAALQLIRDNYLEALVVTNGKAEALTFTADEVFVAPATDQHFKVVDTVGCGDSFSAGFIKKYLAGEDFNLCCQYGNFLGQLNAKYRGAMHQFSATELAGFKRSE